MAGTTPRLTDITSRQARRAAMSVSKAQTLLAGALKDLPEERQDIADHAFALLEVAVKDLRDVVVRLEGLADASDGRPAPGHHQEGPRAG